MNHFPNFRYRRKRADMPTSLDLFSGAGGLSLGFLLAGGRPLGSVDFHSDSIKTFGTNFPMSKFNEIVSIEDWSPSPELKNVDVIFGGPPCQGFSLARGNRFVDDPRNSLYKHFVRVVKMIKPNWIVMENVEGIANIGEGTILKQILEDFSDVGYQLHFKIVNMANFGVPQTRRRAIFVGTRTRDHFEWPIENFVKRQKTVNDMQFDSPRGIKHFSVNDALSDLNLTKGNYFAHRANSQMRGPRNRDANLDPAFTLRVRGDEFALCEKPAFSSFIPQIRIDEPEMYGSPKNDFQALMQMKPTWAKSESMTSTTRIRRQSVQGSRFLTIREQARLQSFPDWFDFHGVRTSKAKQIGNAVPPLFAAQLFHSIFNL